MCRWNAYFGQPILLDEPLYNTQHGLIDQTLHSRIGWRRRMGTASGSAGTSAAPAVRPARYQRLAGVE